MNPARMSRLCVSVVFLAAVAAAQTTSTEILGTVTDSTGAVVPNAKITLLRTATGERRTTTTTSSGDYSFPLIEIGEYTVTAEASGFTTQEKTGITVELQQRARINFELSVGTTRETIEVAGTAVQLKTEDAAVGEVALESMREGLCVQALHVGPYATEAATIDRMVEFAGREGLTVVGPHHEIYLSDPRRSRPERLRTILRYPVRRTVAD